MPELVAGSGITITPDVSAGTITISGGAGVTPQQFGAVADGVTDDSAAFVAAIAYLKAFALNTGGTGFYKGSPKLFIPAGHYYLGTTPLDINHSLIIEGEGSGFGGPEAFGCSRLRWAAGTSGIRVQSTFTSGDTTVDGVQHDGSGGAVIRQLMLQGGYTNADGDHHAIVLRNIAYLDDLYIRKWEGEGVKAWTGNVGGTNYGGNTSTSKFVSVKTENCRGGIDIQGTDSNVITTINCQGFQNRKFGLLDVNAAGSNTHIGWHCTYNGLASVLSPFTQCSDGTYRYAAIYGKTGAELLANAPTAGATNAYWALIGSGGADTSIPLYSSGGPWTWGGDYLCLSAFPTKLDGPYSEGGGFSQCHSACLIVGGTLDPSQVYGGTHIKARFDGFCVEATGASYIHVNSGAGVSAVLFEDLAGVLFGGVECTKGSSTIYRAPVNVGHILTDGAPGGPWTTRLTVNSDGLLVTNSTKALSFNGTQVVGARQTGTPADATDLASALTLVNALKAKLIAHGLIS